METETNEMTISEVAKKLDKKYPHVHRLVRKGRLKARKVGWLWLIERESFVAHVKEVKKKRRSR